MAHARHAGCSLERARAAILQFLEWEEPDEASFARDVRIVLVAAEFSRELTTSVMWLNERNLDITCVRLSPHRHGDSIVLNVETVIPLPEAADYLVRLKEKAAELRWQRGGWSGYWFVNVGEHEHRCWEDARRFGYIAADGEAHFTDQLRPLQPGDRLFAYVNGCGYVGYGEVLAPAVPHRDFVTAQGKRLVGLPLQRRPKREALEDESLLEYCVAVRWHRALDRSAAVKLKPRRRVACRLSGPWLVEQLRQRFGVDNGATPTSIDGADATVDLAPCDT